MRNYNFFNKKFSTKEFKFTYLMRSRTEMRTQSLFCKLCVFYCITSAQYLNSTLTMIIVFISPFIKITFSYVLSYLGSHSQNCFLSFMEKEAKIEVPAGSVSGEGSVCGLRWPPSCVFNVDCPWYTQMEKQFGYFLPYL